MSNSGAADAAIYVNGHIVPAGAAAISALDRGFTLGDGIFETMRARGTKGTTGVRGPRDSGVRVLFLEQHLERLYIGASVLEIPLPAKPELRQAIDMALQASGLAETDAETEAVVRLTATRGVDYGRGLDPPAAPDPTIVVRVAPLARPTAMNSNTSMEPAAAALDGQGVTAVISTIRRNESSPLSRIKSCNYADNILARREARARGAGEAVLLNSAGHVACAAAGNVFCVFGNMLHTPPATSGVLQGITRQAIMDLAGKQGLEAIESVESVLGPEALHAADEVFITNTISGVRPVTQLDGGCIRQAIGGGTPGTITRAVADAYQHLIARDEVWCAPLPTPRAGARQWR